ncbi:MAG: hypothetical protein ACAH80_14510 [Alphaproteobacteria bacterium]
MPINMDIEALLDNELPPAKAQLVRQQLAQNPSALRKYRQLELQKMLLVFWGHMNTVLH